MLLKVMAKETQQPRRSFESVVVQHHFFGLDEGSGLDCAAVYIDHSTPRQADAARYVMTRLKHTFAAHGFKAVDGGQHCAADNEGARVLIIDNCRTIMTVGIQKRVTEDEFVCAKERALLALVL